ncbi:MAG: regulatory protein RecX [Bacteroidales bacterium]
MNYINFNNGSNKPKQRLPSAFKDSKKALSAMQRLCSMREYCRYDINIKLKKLELSDNERKQIIISLEEDKFLDNSRYAVAFVRDKAAFNGWGTTKIRWALKLKKVEEEIIEEAMKQLPPEDELQRLSLLLNKKIKSLNREQEKAKVRVKLIRFAISRGFDYDKVIPVVNKIMANFVKDKPDFN